MPRTARASVWDYCYHVIDCGNGRAVVFRIGSRDERMAALLDLDASLRPIGRPQKLVEI
jgi:REP element-mobilizing transposase RayT